MPTMTAMPALIRNLAHELSGNAVSIQSLAPAWGAVAKRYTGSGYALTPIDPRLASIWVGIASDRTGAESVTDFEFELRPPQPALQDMAAVLGSFDEMPPPPSGDPHVVAFHYDAPGQPHTVEVFATLTRPAATQGALVKRVTLRRDRR